MNQTRAELSETISLPADVVWDRSGDLSDLFAGSALELGGLRGSWAHQVTLTVSARQRWVGFLTAIGEDAEDYERHYRVRASRDADRLSCRLTTQISPKATNGAATIRIHCELSSTASPSEVGAENVARVWLDALLRCAPQWAKDAEDTVTDDDTLANHAPRSTATGTPLGSFKIRPAHAAAFTSGLLCGLTLSRLTRRRS